MIQFKQKEYAEFDAMRTLYNEFVKAAQGDRRRIPSVINTSSLIPILKGNNIVIERFVISTSMFGKDKYRMYIRVGAKAKMPDEVRLPGKDVKKTILGTRLKFHGRLFSNKDKGPQAAMEVHPEVSMERTITESLGEVIKYDKKERLLVLEFKDLKKALEAINILPFGINYKYYLLDA